MYCYNITEVHVNNIKVGDTILINNVFTTINRNHIGGDSFFGRTLFGYSYKLGTELVKRVDLGLKTQTKYFSETGIHNENNIN